MMAKKKRKYSAVRHKQIYLVTRGHSVDIHVYPVMQQLWDAGVQTFYSCQGGPDRFCSDGNFIKNDRAMVVILKKDQKQTMRILAHLNPKKSPWKNRYSRDRIAIKFDPSPEANAVQVKVAAE